MEEGRPICLPSLLGRRAGSKRSQNRSCVRTYIWVYVPEDAVMFLSYSVLLFGQRSIVSCALFAVSLRNSVALGSNTDRQAFIMISQQGLGCGALPDLDSTVSAWHLIIFVPLPSHVSLQLNNLSNSFVF